MDHYSSHAIVLDLTQAELLWKLDAAWNEEHSTLSAFAEAARDISAYRLDASLSGWEVPASSVGALQPLLAAVSHLLPPSTVSAAADVIAELQAVANGSASLAR